MPIKSNFLLSTLLVLLTTTFNSYCQGTTEFEIKLPEQPTAGAKYGKFRFVDQRNGPGLLGFVQTGALNRKSMVFDKIPIEQQLTKVFDALADKTKIGELLFQLRYCAFSEQTLSMNEHGFFVIRANVYAKKGDLYQSVFGIDTMIRVSAVDVTNKLLRTGGEAFVKLIDSGLKRDPRGKMYSFNDVVKIDSIEKKGFAAYDAKVLTDGIYNSSLSFFLQLPDSKIDSGINEIDNITFYTVNEKGKLRKLKATNCYSVVYKGDAYISYDGYFYKLARRDDEYLLSINLPVGTDPYTGTDVIPTSYGMAGGINGGAIGGLIGVTFDVAMKPRNKEIFIKLDHVTGKLMIQY
ncbi:hypothetical protein [Mucilaginibacter calamicampi]